MRAQVSRCRISSTARAENPPSSAITPGDSDWSSSVPSLPEMNGPSAIDRIRPPMTPVKKREM